MPTESKTYEQIEDERHSERVELLDNIVSSVLEQEWLDHEPTVLLDYPESHPDGLVDLEIVCISHFGRECEDGIYDNYHTIVSLIEEVARFADPYAYENYVPQGDQIADVMDRASTLRKVASEIIAIADKVEAKYSQE